MMYFANKIMNLRQISNELHLLTTIENISSIINNGIIQQIIYKNIETGLESCSYTTKFLADLKFVVERNATICDEICINVANIDYLISNISSYKHDINKIREHLDNNDTTHAINYMKSLDNDIDLITVNTKNIFSDLGLETEGVF